VRYDALDQENLFDFVPVKSLGLAVDVDHNRFQGHGHYVAANDRAVAEFDGIFGKAPESDGNAAAGRFVGRDFERSGADSESFFREC